MSLGTRKNEENSKEKRNKGRKIGLIEILTVIQRIGNVAERRRKRERENDDDKNDQLYSTRSHMLVPSPVQLYQCRQASAAGASSGL